MIFENLSEKLQNALNKLRGKGKLTEKDVDLVMREVKLALLESDVNFKVVKNFISSVKERAIGKEVMESLTPGQQVVKIVNEELTALMGEKEEKIQISSKPPTIIMLCGLQGAGKTTHAGKLCKYFLKQNKKPLLVACDVYRPAAIKQLQVVGKSINVPVFTIENCKDVTKIANESIKYANSNSNDIVILDTAGRLHIDEVLMDELKSIKESLNPIEILLVVDSMTGQDAVNVAKSFNDTLDITGVIMTKLDGDARGGAALSIKAITKKAIKFVGVGEKMDDLEPFYPDRMASRILGMGDILSVIDKVQKQFDLKKTRELEEKIRKQTFTLEDFLNQMRQVRNMGPIQDLLAMMPGVNSKMLKNVNVDEKELDKIEAMILSMTRKERENPDILDNSRKQRITKGSGTNITALNKLLKQFKESKKMMKKMQEMTKGVKKKGKFGLPFFK
ncbi:hypothetical protein HMPREF3188_00340 [Tissierellia bacterium KA00581]|nr:hypothetical protein HMPREF3188_00340 [Tissierellia bacterium KA00581]